jgi:hypothetical protein
MSNAVPMTARRRLQVYVAQRARMTPRQARQVTRMATRNAYRATPHGGSGTPVRKPLPRSKNGRGGSHRAATDGPAQTPAPYSAGAGPAAPAPPVGGGAGGRVPTSEGESA